MWPPETTRAMAGRVGMLWCDEAMERWSDEAMELWRFIVWFSQFA